MNISILTLSIVVGLLILVSGRAELRVRKLKAQLGSAYDAAEVLQSSFNRFAPWQIVDELANGSVPDAIDCTVTVLFVDIRGFTQMSETLTPMSIIALLNRYYAVVSDSVARNNGHVAKFMGDGALAVFGALERNPWQVGDAAHAALDMASAAAAMDLSEHGLMDGLKLSIGIHTGQVIAGVTGSGDLLEFTVIGRTVNLASRLEALNRELGTDILVSDAVRRELDNSFELVPHPPQNVKGLSVPIVPYSLIGCRT